MRRGLERALPMSTWRFSVIQRLLSAILVGLLLVGCEGCASLGGARHGATVSVVTAHATLSAVQDAEMLLVCSKPGAPAPPLCIDADKHHEISGKLATAFGLDGDLARLVRAVPVDGPTPAQVGELVGKISAIVNDVLALIPNGSPQKASLQKQLEAK